MTNRNGLRTVLVMLMAGALLAACGTTDTPTVEQGISVPAEVSATGLTADELNLTKVSLQHELFASSVALGRQNPLVVRVTRDELQEAALREREQREVFPGPKLVGVVRDVQARVDLSSIRLAQLSSTPRALKLGGIRAAGDNGFVWTAAVESEGAASVRLHLSDVALPEGVSLFVYNADGDAYGPLAVSDELWTPSVMGSRIYLQLQGEQVRAAAPVKAPFVIDRIGHIDPVGLDLDATAQYGIGTTCYGAPCTVNAACENVNMGGAESAIAHYQYIKRPYIYMCTGGLLADSDPSSEVPYFLTANHCVAKSREADTIEFFFDYVKACGETCGDAEQDAVKVAGGATILSTNSTGDYTLLQMNSAPPAGRVFLGWDTTEIAYSNGAGLYRLAHPSGGPLAYSEHVVDTAKGTCSSWPRGGWIYSTDTLGATEGGSSGSPVLNGANQVVGQLSGGCGTNVSDNCDTESNATVDGAFAGYYDEVAGWLGGGNPAVCGDGDCNGDETCDTCPGDCGACPTCGDGTCDAGEDCSNCPGDCGACPFCGDGTCDSGEDCNSCEADCGACPTCGAKGDPCSSGADCCSNRCHPKKGTCQ